MRGTLTSLLCLAVLSTPAFAQSTQASWSCSANATLGERGWSNGPLGPVQRTANGFVIRRTTSRYPGSDLMTGRIGEKGMVRMTGGGSYPSVGRSWTYRNFSGRYIKGGVTVLSGRMVNSNGSTRTCSIRLNL
jgi:hypothetical protein